MKKPILATLSVSILLSSLLLAKIPDSDVQGVKDYEKAVADFKNKDFFKSYELFRSLRQKYPDDVELNFYVGRCALELKDYEQASASFERVLIKEPMNARAKLELARAYFEMNQLDESENLFKEVRADPRTPATVQEAIKKFLIAIDAKRQKSFTNFFFMATAGYDSNVNLQIGEGAIGSAYGITGLVPILNADDYKKKEDYYVSELLGVSNLYDIGSRGEMFIKSSLAGFNQNYRQLTDYNLGLIAASTGPSYMGKDYELNFPVHYNRIWKAATLYMKDYGVSARYNKFFSDTLSAYAGVTLKWNVYDDQSPGNGGAGNKNNDVFTKLFVLGGSKKFAYNITFSPTLSYGADAPTRTPNASNQKTYTALNLQLKKALGSKWEIFCGYNMKDSYYEVYNQIFRKTRRDSQRDYSIGTQYTINKSSNIKVEYKYSDVSSNIQAFDYYKDTATVNYFYLF